MLLLFSLFCCLLFVLCFIYVYLCFRRATTDPITYSFTSCHSNQRHAHSLHCMFKLAALFSFFGFVEEDKTYSNNSLWLSTVLNHLQTGTPISLIITNANSHLGCFQPLKPVAVTPTPLVDVLEKSQYDLWGCEFWISQRDSSFIHYSTPCVSDLAEINNEAVSTIEAGPRQIHLCGTNGTSPLNVKQTLHIHVISHHVLESRGHTTLLCRGERKSAIEQNTPKCLELQLK